MIDITSYLLGKEAGGGGGGGNEPQAVVDEGYTGSSQPSNRVGNVTQFIEKINVEITTDNWRYLFYGLPKLQEVNIVDSVKPTSVENMFRNCTALTKVSLFDTSETTTFREMFGQCYAIPEIPPFDTRNVGNFYNAFFNCRALTTFPQLDASGVTSASGFSNMFQGSQALSDESLNNILGMCISAVNFTGTKKLGSLGIVVSTYAGDPYPPTRFENLPNYQAFLDAGWTLT